MKTIVKGTEPASLAAHRRANPADYEGFSDKEALRDALVNEQRGICCYCMGRIRNERRRMKIEHWKCQERYPSERLRYGNLLGACLGGEGQPGRLQHCDTSKGSKDLLWNPAEPAHRIEAHVRYGGDGTISSKNRTFDANLNVVLNLNILILKNNRKATLDGIVAWWKLEKARLHGPIPRIRFERERRRLLAGNGNLRPFFQVAVWWIEERLKSMAA